MSKPDAESSACSTLKGCNNCNASKCALFSFLTVALIGLGVVVFTATAFHSFYLATINIGNFNETLSLGSLGYCLSMPNASDTNATLSTPNATHTNATHTNATHTNATHTNTSHKNTTLSKNNARDTNAPLSMPNASYTNTTLSMPNASDANTNTNLSMPNSSDTNTTCTSIKVWYAIDDPNVLAQVKIDPLITEILSVANPVALFGTAIAIIFGCCECVVAGRRLSYALILPVCIGAACVIAFAAKGSGLQSLSAGSIGYLAALAAFVFAATLGFQEENFGKEKENKKKKPAAGGEQGPQETPGQVEVRQKAELLNEDFQKKMQYLNDAYENERPEKKAKKKA